MEVTSYCPFLNTNKGVCHLKEDQNQVCSHPPSQSPTHSHKLFSLFINYKAHGTVSQSDKKTLYGSASSSLNRILNSVSTYFNRLVS